jgi:hypothetical protein
MLIDQLGVFFDNAPAAASAVSPAVSVPPFAGRDGAANITVMLTGAGPGSLSVTLQESDDKTTWTDAGAYSLNKAAAAGEVLTFARPYPVGKKFVRLA